MFPRDRTRSNVAFESYKTASSSSPPRGVFHPFPGEPVTEARVHSKTLLSVREMQSRVRHDHLALGWGGWLGWLDAGGSIWAAKIGKDFAPIYSKLCSLPESVSAASAPPAEYPSLHALSPTTYLASDGTGRLYPLSITPSASSLSARLGPAYELVDESTGELRPFRVEWVGGERQALVSTVRRKQDGMTGLWGKEAGFEVSLVSFGDNWREAFEGEDKVTRALDVQWSLEADDLPLYTHFDGARFVLASASEFRPSSSSTAFLEKEESAASTATSAAPPSAPVYLSQSPHSWTQTSTSITLNFQLPPGTARTEVIPTLTTSSISIFLAGEHDSHVVGFGPSDARRTWWDAIRVSDSVWTYDPPSGALTFELEKANASTRWPSLFRRPSDAHSTAEAEAAGQYEDVPETLDAEKLASITASLDKFTREMDVDENGEVLEPVTQLRGLGHSLKDEIDELDEREGDEMAGVEETAGMEDETRVGRDVRFSAVLATGGAEGSGVLQAETVKVEGGQGKEVWLGSSLKWAGNNGQDPSSDILLKHSLDALVFHPPSSSAATEPLTFTHTKTFPALSYVLASKRALKYTLHTATCVLAFSSPTTSGAEGDVFVYWDAEGRTTAPSRVVKLGGGDEQGALLGVKGVVVESEEEGEKKKEKVLVALCERGLVLMRGLL